MYKTNNVFARVLLAVLFALPVAALAGAQSISPELYNGLKWRLIGPFRGGRAVAAAGIPGSPNTFYFGSVNGGIWKSTDAGIVWTPIFENQGVASIGALAIAPSDPKVIYAGTGESDIRSNLSSGNGVYKSTDGGETWSHVGLENTRQISRIVVDPRDANVVFVATLGHAYAANPERGVFKSTDGGAHWARVLDQGPEVGAADIAIAADKPEILFATMWCAHRPPWSTYAPIGGPGSGLWRSQDGGRTWARLTGAGLPDGDWSRSGVAVSADGRRVYAVIDAKQAGLYRSDDGGNTWSLISSDRRLTGRSWYFSIITIDPQNPDVIYVPNVSLYRSEDGGKTISVLRGAPGGDDYHQIWIDPRDSTRMLLVSDQGATISLNYGKTWSSWNNQPTAQLYHVITDDKFPYTVYGNQQDSGAIGVLSRSDHNQITVGDAFSASGSEAGYIAPDPHDSNILYVSSTYGGVVRYDLRTSFSQDITPWPIPSWGSEIYDRKYRAPWAPVLLFSLFDNKTLYLGTQFVMKSTDGGLHWQAISRDLTGSTRKEGDPKPEGTPSLPVARQKGYGVVFTIAPSKLNGDVIWAGSDTGMIHLTTDGGKTWKNVTPPGLPLWGRVSFIEASQFTPAEAYAAVDCHRLDDQKPYLYRTRDYGLTWQRVNNGISAPAFVRAVREDPQKKGLLYAGTEFGVYVSFDEGDHWQSLQLNLPVTSVYDLVIHGDDLVVATHGRSFWILDDVTPLRQMADAAQASAWLYRPGMAMRVDNDQFPGTPLPPEEPAAENPPNGAMIDYYLKTAASQVKIEIFDSQHTLISHFSSGELKQPKRGLVPIADRWFPKPQMVENTPGMHRFVWNLSWWPSGDESADLDDDDHYVLHGPRVTAGNYEVRFTVDGQTSSQPLVVAMDPRCAGTPDELKHQFELGREIFVEALHGRRAEAEVASVKKQFADLLPKLDAQGGAIRESVLKLQTEIAQIGGGNPAAKVLGLQDANSGVTAALRVVASSDRAIPSQAIDVYEEYDRVLKARIDDWAKLKSGSIAQLNEQLKQKNLAPIPIAEIEAEVEYLMTR